MLKFVLWHCYAIRLTLLFSIGKIQRHWAEKPNLEAGESELDYEINLTLDSDEVDFNYV